jgi:phosphomannomutase
MEGFRAAPPAGIGGFEVSAVKDYERRIAREGGVERPLGLPASNVIAYALAGGSRVTLRPSGTEPKIKYYFELREGLGAGESVAEATARGRERLDRLAEDLLVLARDRGQPA